jgi:hypothetical protein
MTKKTGRDNLIPANQRTPEEWSKIASAGGIASGAARREKRRTLDMIEAWLDATDDTGETTNENAYIRAVIRRGIRTGDTKLLELLAQLRGELVQKSEIDLNGAIPAVLTDDMIVDDDIQDIPEEKPKKAGKGACKKQKSG